MTFFIAGGASYIIKQTSILNGYFEAILSRYVKPKSSNHNTISGHIVHYSYMLCYKFLNKQFVYEYS